MNNKINAFAVVTGIFSSAVYALLMKWLGTTTVVVGSITLCAVMWSILIIALKKSGISFEYRSVYKVSFNRMAGLISIATMLVCATYLALTGHKDIAMGIAIITTVSSAMGLVSPIPKGILE